ncbi:MAG: DUF1569 domain-containing protein [Planctomycetes bacterium]|nr:DUF1569 domain-containing protein [Planctomycetota bacterium]
MTDTLFSSAGLDSLLGRLDALRPDSRRQWGKMDVAQMLAHCQQPLRVALGELALKRMLVGILFGRLAKKKLLAPAPWKPGMPTAPQFKITDAREFAKEKAALRALVERFGKGGPGALTKQPHPFFGPLTVAEWQALQWRHLDHHLRQFGC